MNGLDHLISDHGKKFGSQMPFGHQTFYQVIAGFQAQPSHFTMSLDVLNGPFKEWNILDHLNAKLVG